MLSMQRAYSSATLAMSLRCSLPSMSGPAREFSQNGLKFEKETSHELVRRRRVASMA